MFQFSGDAGALGFEILVGIAKRGCLAALFVVILFVFDEKAQDLLAEVDVRLAQDRLAGSPRDIVHRTTRAVRVVAIRIVKRDDLLEVVRQL
ncbi:MAG: hypothetical protein U5O39_06370 [Gammaproteobacteria bacterium]|nr:hypothetical protein [Gammaproteobacteria bacterium]